MTAKSVIVSAKRLIDVRHCCRSSNRIAEISVPACPIPIHQTKLIMSKPQPTGTLTPQMPIPLYSKEPMVSTMTPSNPNPNAAPKYHGAGGLLAGISPMCSVIVP